MIIFEIARAHACARVLACKTAFFKNSARARAARVLGVRVPRAHAFRTRRGRTLLQAIEDIFTEENWEGEARNFEYLHPIWIGNDGPARAKPGDWSDNVIVEDDGRPSPCDNPAAEGEILFCYDKVKCQLEDWTNYLFEHDTNPFNEDFQADVWEFLRNAAGTGLEWPVGGHSLYVRVVIEFAWDVVKNDRSPEAYRIAKWLYSVDFMKYQVSSEYNCEEPYLTKEDIHNFLSSRPCPNWFEGHFKTVLFPNAAGPDRELRQTVAYPLVEGLPSNYILEEILLDFLWHVPLGEDGNGVVELDHLDYTFSMTKWTILGDHDIDLANLQESVHAWVETTIEIFSKKFWASPVVAGQLKDWVKTYKVSPQLLVKYELLADMEKTEQRAACDQEASVADHVWKEITDLTFYEGLDGGRGEFLHAIEEIYKNNEFEVEKHNYEYLLDIWTRAEGAALPCDHDYTNWAESTDYQEATKYDVLVELEAYRNPCGGAETNADRIAAKIMALPVYADNGSGTDDGRDEMLQASVRPRACNHGTRVFPHAHALYAFSACACAHVSHAAWPITE